MIEHVVQTISLNYSVVEDRLELRCKSGLPSYQLWLTQRMWLQLTPAIIKWLVDSGVGAPHTKGFIKDSFAENKSDPVELPTTVDAGKPATEHTTNESSASDDLSSEITTKWIPEPWLCTTANLQMASQSIRIQFVADCSQHVFIFSMSALEACHFLIAQKNALKKSGWSFAWPAWLLGSEEQEQESIETSLH
ncbi:hypothetical protein MAQ5080_00363 [Marinomonas aquimarina]|uniref:Uncharacterized protein n=1 Tax=Marinomonas aquimarina TaxID=295068 RepID=A0A1A8T266_9GAMM|nr:hypothetical protein [Marinomonas aquimarina]SBS25780.1 hypothetical protein MAQ5080_00363 [Marinomonas aquimarina]